MVRERPGSVSRSALWCGLSRPLRLRRAGRVAGVFPVGRPQQIPWNGRRAGRGRSGLRDRSVIGAVPRWSRPMSGCERLRLRGAKAAALLPCRDVGPRIARLSI